MILTYGSYIHDTNSVAITSWQRSYVLSENQWPKFLKVAASFKAKLVGSSLFSRAYAMQAAYLVQGQSLAMYDNSNSNTLIWSIDSSQTVGGLLVTSPVSFTDVRGAQGATYLYCDFAVEALFPMPTNNRILSFSESITFDDIDGGPIQVERIPAVGSPILQNVTEQSFFYATQEGQLTAGYQNPAPMDPIQPSMLRRVPGARRITQMAPRTIRGVPHEWGCRWSYQMVSTSPIVGMPNVR